MADSNAATTGRLCPLCGSAGPFEVVDEIMCAVCECGHLFQEDGVNVFTVDIVNEFANGRPTRWHSGSDLLYGAGVSDAVLHLRSRGAVGNSAESRKINKEIYQRKAARELHGHLRMVLRRLTKGGPSNHPFYDRILGLFDLFRNAVVESDEQTSLGLRKHLRMTWGKAAQAALAACVFAIFREEDANRHLDQAHCYSLHLAASCSETTYKAAKTWFTALTKLFPSRFGSMKGDEPILHVEQICDWWQQQANPTPDITAASDTPPVHLIKTFDAFTDNDWLEVRSLSRSLCAMLLGPDSEVFETAQELQIRSGAGQWAYYIVLWALGAIRGQRLQGKDWIRKEYILASQGMLHNASTKDGNGDDDVDDENEDEDGEEINFAKRQDNDESWRYIRLYQDIGQALALYAAKLPWVPQNVMRKVKGGRTALKEGLEVQYIRDIVAFSSELQALATKSARPVPSTRATPEPPTLAIATKADPTARRTVTASKSRASSSSKSMVAPRPSYTSINFPHLSDDPELLDTLDPATVDALLFAPGEMTSYLRSDGAERDVIRQRKVAAGEWTEQPDDGNNNASSRGARPGRKRSKHSPSPSEMGDGAGDESGRKRKSGSRRTKADERLLAAARDVEAPSSGPPVDDWSDSDTTEVRDTDEADTHDDGDDDDDEMETESVL